MPTENPAESMSTDLVGALIAMATAEADAVANAISKLDIRMSSDPPASAKRRFPKEFLLAMQLSARFAIWERDGHTFHLEAGLPSGVEVIERAYELVRGPELLQFVNRLSTASLML